MFIDRLWHADIVKLDADGNVLWQSSWGGSSYDSFNAVAIDSDGYVVVGYIASSDILGLASKGGEASIVKYDKNGNMMWQNKWADEYVKHNIFRSVIATGSNYVAIGEAGSYSAAIISFNLNGEVDYTDL